ncbi:ABC-2 transporter permease [Ornithinibacillus xuwenensis]|uniref:ABC-2 transporter permease n=1 Tax=Ornithinibacillus xuwenensis TaxID=3144668 RepID=A0ABU9XJZ3_9BACI
MLSLLKKDLFVNKATVIAGLLLVPIGYITTLPPFYISLGLMLPLIFIHPYIMDYRSNINRLMISLPVTAKSIVTSRYLLLMMIWIAVIFYQYLIGFIVEEIFNYSSYIFGWKEIVILLSLGLLLLSIYVPLTYSFRSLVIVLLLVVITYFIMFLFTLDALVNILELKDNILFNDLDQGVVPLIETYIPFHPYLTLPFVAFFLYYLSLKLSAKTFTVK